MTEQVFFSVLFIFSMVTVLDLNKIMNNELGEYYI